MAVIGAIRKLAAAYETDILTASIVELDKMNVKAKWALRIKGNYAYLIKNLAWKFINKEFREQIKEGRSTFGYKVTNS